MSESYHYNVPSKVIFSIHMGNSQFKSNTYIRFANILRTQRCYNSQSEYYIKTTEGYYYQF
jgi:hypothetical protein